MKLRILLAIVLAALFPAAVHPAVPAIAAPSDASGPLYQATWAPGLQGWQTVGHAGWQASKGILGYRSTGITEIVAPFQTGKLTNFAVEAEIAPVGSVERTLSVAERGYGLFVRSSGGRFSGVAGGFFYGEPSGGQNFFNPQSRLYWHGDAWSGADVALHAGYNTFRLEVRGSRYTVIENGVPTVSLAIPGYAGTRLGIFSRGYRIRVKSFRVVPLASRPSGIDRLSAVISRVRRLNLQRPDIPAGFQRFDGYYFPNAEVAAQRGVSVSSLVQRGRLLGYLLDYRHLLGNSFEDLQAVVTAYSGASGAHADYAHIVAGNEQNAGAPAYHESNPHQFGSEDTFFTYQDMFQGTSYTNDIIVFHRGDYRVSVSLAFPVGKVSTIEAAQILDSAAHNIDGRIKRAG